MELNRLIELIDQSIALELNAADLYRLFSAAFPQDNEFWWQLHIEERSHATLIRAAKDSFVKRGKFPSDLIGNSLRELQAANERISEMIKDFTTQPPSREEACRIAIGLEQETGERHFEQFMNKDAQTSLETVFQQLNRSDKDHEERIRVYLEKLMAKA